MAGAGWATLTNTKWRALAFTAAATETRNAARSTVRNCSALAGLGCATPTRWTNMHSRGTCESYPPPTALAKTGWHPMGSRATEGMRVRSEEHTSELQSRLHLVCRLLLE